MKVKFKFKRGDYCVIKTNNFRWHAEYGLKKGQLMRIEYLEENYHYGLCYAVKFISKNSEINKLNGNGPFFMERDMKKFKGKPKLIKALYG